MSFDKFLLSNPTDFQVSAARLVISFSRADNETKKNLLDSYTAMVRQYEEAKYHNREQEQNQGFDEVLDDPRHGQADPVKVVLILVIVGYLIGLML